MARGLSVTVPSGQTHLRATLALGAASLVLCEVYDQSQMHTLGVFTGALMTPDLDVDQGMYTNYILRKISRPLVYAFWWYFLIPGSVFYWSWAVGLMAADALHITLDILDELFTETRRPCRQGPHETGRWERSGALVLDASEASRGIESRHIAGARVLLRGTRSP